MILVKYEATCDYCGVTVELSACTLNPPYGYSPPAIPYPSLPPDWTFVNGNLVCERHTVVVDLLG